MRKSCLSISGWLLLASICSGQTSESGKTPCPVKGVPANWITYADRAHGFCFSYPPIYVRMPKPWLAANNNQTYAAYLRKAAREGRVLRLQHRQLPDASIVLLLNNKAFDLESFISQAPTGNESPPEPEHLGPNIFYYYGPSGGGVDYPDGYYFELKGETLQIVFAGPYTGKTPSQETKALEKQMLSNLRTF